MLARPAAALLFHWPQQAARGRWAREGGVPRRLLARQPMRVFAAEACARQRMHAFVCGVPSLGHPPMCLVRPFDAFLAVVVPVQRMAVARCRLLGRMPRVWVDRKGSTACRLACRLLVACMSYACTRAVWGLILFRCVGQGVVAEVSALGLRARPGSLPAAIARRPHRRCT